MTILEMLDVGKCVETVLAFAGTPTATVPAGSPGSAEVTLVDVVGANSPNLKPDVVNIQYALNRVPVEQGGPKPKLVVEGRCGAETIKAIQVFQLKHFGWPGADRKVEPGKQTHLKLKEFSAAVAANPEPTTEGPLDPIADADFIETVRKSLAVAHSAAKAAQMNLRSAAAYLDAPEGGFGEFSRSSKMYLVNRCFDIDKFPIAMRRQMLTKVQGIFDAMLQMLARPGGLWGVHSIQPDALGLKRAYAYQNSGGYYNPGGTHTSPKYKGIRGDAIYVTRRLKELGGEGPEHALLHEMAHFVGPPKITGGAIGDKFIGPPWVERNRFKTPYQKVHTAESYAYFAREAKFGPNIRVLHP